MGLKKDNDPVLYENLCNTIFAVFCAEQEVQNNEDMINKMKNKKLTPQEYVEAVADVILESVGDEDAFKSNFKPIL